MMELQNVNQEAEVKKETSDFNESKKIAVIKPTASFVGASWLTFMIGLTSYCIGLWNSEMQLNEKGYYFAVIMFGLFAVISVQKNVRDKLEGLKVTELYYGISWFAAILSISLLVIGLWNADLWLSEKGFFGISYLMAIYSAICIQKNTRDAKVVNQL